MCYRVPTRAFKKFNCQTHSFTLSLLVTSYSHANSSSRQSSIGVLPFGTGKKKKKKRITGRILHRLCWRVCVWKVTVSPFRSFRIEWNLIFFVAKNLITRWCLKLFLNYPCCACRVGSRSFWTHLVLDRSSFFYPKIVHRAAVDPGGITFRRGKAYERWQ